MKKNYPIKKDDLAEFVGQMIDAFEDLLAEKGITLDNPEIQEAIDDGADPDELAIIYGSDYDYLQNRIEETVFNWKLAEPW